MAFKKSDLVLVIKLYKSYQFCVYYRVHRGKVTNFIHWGNYSITGEGTRALFKLIKPW